MPIIIPSSTAVELESLALDGLELNDNVTFRIEALTDTPAAKRPEWISGADSNGAILARDPLYENAVTEIRLRVVQQATMDAALVRIGEIEDKLQECSRNIPDGLPLTWTPATGTNTITFRCLLGEFTERPIDEADSGWFQFSPVVGLRLTRAPFGEGVESLLGTVTSTDPIITREITGFAGDVHGRGRIVVTDAATQARRWVAWGLESRWYPLSAPPSLIVDSADMTWGGIYAGTLATRDGAYGGESNNVIQATLRPQRQTICLLPNRANVGAFRPQLRVYASSPGTTAIRLVWQAGSGPDHPLTYQAPVVEGWNNLDLGAITIPEAVLGTQRWTGRLEAYSTATGGEIVEVDAIWLMPAESFARARSPFTYRPGAVLARDEFTDTTAGAALNGRTAPLGGTWATSGTTTDFSFVDSPTESAGRGAVSDPLGAPRFAILGGNNYTDTEAGVRVRSTRNASQSQVLIVRWVDIDNHLRVIFQAGLHLVVTKRVAGASTNIASSPLSSDLPGASYDRWYRIRAVVFGSGRGMAWLLDDSGGTLITLPFSDDTLATGALSSGRMGFADYHPTTLAMTRFYDEFYMGTPSAESIACYSGQSIEFRHDGTLREDSTGTYAGVPPEHVGSYVTIPPAGGPGRKARVAVMARRNDVATMPDDHISDSTTVEIYGVPRYWAIPR